MIGFLIFLGGLVWGAVVAGVPHLYIGIDSLIILGIGIFSQVHGPRNHLFHDLVGAAMFKKAETAWDINELKDHQLYRQAVETARCLSVGVLTTVHDANIGSLFSMGFPAWTDGAMQFIYGMGINSFIERCDQLTAQFGPGFGLSSAVKDAIRQHRPVY